MNAENHLADGNKVEVPVWFVILAGMALAWNLLGLAAVIMDFMMSAESIASLSEAQQQMYASRPAWSSFASLLAVTAGTFGCIGLVLKRTWARPILVLSLIGLIAQDIAFFVIMDAIGAYGIQVVIMQGIVFVIAVALLILAQFAMKKQWLH